MATKKKQHVKSNYLKHLLSGAVAGAFSRTVSSPFERIKVLRQTLGGKYNQNSIPSVFRIVWQEEGLIGFFKGNGVNCLRVMPYSAAEFYSFELYKHEFLPEDRKSWSKLQHLACGGAAGMTASTLVYPLDFLRTMLSIQTTEETRKYVGIGDAFKKIYRSSGVMGFYRGWPACMMGISPYVAVKMTSFDMLKHRFLINKQNHPLFDLYNLVLGATAGVIAVTLTYPTDLLKRRMQLQGYSPDFPKYNSVFSCAADIYKQNGVKGLYRGLVPSYLKVIPSVSLAFTTNERLKRVFGIHHQRARQL